MVRILSQLNGLIWLALTLGGALLTISLFVFDQVPQAIFAGFCVVCSWVAWHILSSWLFGLQRHVVKFMRAPIDRLTFVDKSLRSQRVVDVLQALSRDSKSLTATAMAVDNSFDLKNLQTVNPKVESLTWRTIDIEGDKLLNIPGNGVYFFTANGIRAIAKARVNQRFAYDSEGESTIGADGEISGIQLIASSIEDANAIVHWLLSESSCCSVHRSQMLHVNALSPDSPMTHVQVVKRPKIERDRIILPAETIELAETLVSGRSKHHKRLAELGYSSRLGLLLYGPPGTGKTMMIKLLLSQVPDHTVVIPVDLAPETIRECFRLAAYLEPTVVVIEDVDLLASNRTTPGAKLDSLQELMNQIDGLFSTSNTMIILSTNRPEVLEPALATRPGRVSQAIELPLPDQQSRLNLLKLFLGELATDRNANSPDLANWAARTDKASPAFLQELCKRAILLSCDRTSATHVQEEDMREAMHQLVVIGGKLNRNVLGFPDGAASPETL